MRQARIGSGSIRGPRARVVARDAGAVGAVWGAVTATWIVPDQHPETAGPGAGEYRQRFFGSDHQQGVLGQGGQDRGPRWGWAEPDDQVRLPVGDGLHATGFGGGDNLGGDPRATARRIVERSHAAWSTVSGWNTPVTIVLGTVPAAQAIAIITYSNLIHSWDLAVAMATARRSSLVKRKPNSPRRSAPSWCR